MDEIKAKQQVVEKIKEASKILVTVSDDPSVDALAAALGLTLLFDKQEKYATAIFSGHTPPAIAFLEPEKTFDDTTDSLRDFIIALNKEKADHLRYKIEGDSVKIFITPYKTVINHDDLEFSQGDYNVELVIALGVDNQDHLDKALENHGQILHDATIVTISAGDQTSDLGGIDWHDAGASSMSEMVVGLAEALKEDKKKSLLNSPIATALLTGIVAQTDRFSNEHTTSKAMTVAATLMAAGADQQLIANELQQAHSIAVDSDDTSEDDTQFDVDTDDEQASDGDKDNSNDDGLISIDKDPTTLSIAHDGETLAELDERIRGEEASKEKIEEEIEAVEEEAEAAAEKREQEAIAATTPKREEAPSDSPNQPSNAYALDDNEFDIQDKIEEEPTFGGTLNATTDQAEEDARRAIADDQNRTILSHAYIGDNSTPDTPAGFPGAPAEAPGSQGIDDFASSASVHSAYAPEESPTLSGQGGERVIQPLGAQEPVATPPEQTTPEPAPFQPSVALPLPPAVPDFSQGLAAVVPPEAPIKVEPAQRSEILGDILAPEPLGSEPSTSLGIDYEATNSTPAPGSAYAFDETPTPPPQGPPTPPAASNPGQFQIPGQ